MATDETTYVFEYPSGTARFYIRGKYVYSMSGEAAYWIKDQYWYPFPQSGSPAFWVREKYIYEYPVVSNVKYFTR
jgi:hypothetical protein